MISQKEMLPYLNLVSAIFKRAKKDIKQNNKYAKDAHQFIESEWGEFLQKDLMFFGKIINDDSLKENRW
jgi:hypothetical protein